MTEHNQNTAKLNSLIKDVRIAMLTTIDNGVLRSRPMDTQQTDTDGELWFMTSGGSHKMEEIKSDNRVNLAYSDPSSNTYVSVSGTATLVTDRAKIEELWQPIHKAWFPKGKDDPNLCLLKVSIEQAEYWDASSSTLVQLVGFVKAIATGTSAEYGDHGKVNL